jgi:phage protein D
MMTNTPLFANVRPDIEIDGLVQDQLSDALLSLTITAAVTEMARLKARFRNWGTTNGREDFLHFDGGILAFGQEIKISQPDRDGSVLLFQGRITAIEGLYSNGPPEIQIYAEDGLEALRHTRRSRSFQDVTDAAVFEMIASEYGLQTDFDFDSPAQAVIAQLDQTDMAFLLERARRLGLDVWVEGSTLHIRPRTAAEPAGDLTFGQDLLAFRVRADLAEQVTELGVTGWDVDSKEALDATADDRLVPTQLFGDRTGSTLLEETFGTRTERLVRQVPLDQPEAQALADGHFLARAYRFVVGEGEVAGRLDLQAGKTVSLGGLGPWFDGAYHVVAIRHHFDLEQELRTTFTAERPALGAGSGSTYGRIRRRKTRPQRPETGIPSRRGQPSGPGKESKPSPRQKPEPKPKPEPKADKRQETRLVDTTVHTVLDHQTPPPEKLDDPAVTRPSKRIKDEGE